MAAISCPCSFCKGKVVSSRKVRNSHMKMCCTSLFMHEQSDEERDEKKTSDIETEVIEPMEDEADFLCIETEEFEREREPASEPDAEEQEREEEVCQQVGK